MTKILIIGDSHTFRMVNSIDQEYIDYCKWNNTESAGSINSKCDAYHITKSYNLPIDIYFSGHKGRSAYSYSFIDGFPCIKENLSDDTIVLPFFGYIDIKNLLPTHKNTKEAVSKYIKNNLDFFKNNKIRFIEPIPQFINILGTGNVLLPFEDRYPYHIEFINELRKQSEENGLEKPINTESIFEIDKFDESYECHDCISCNDPVNKNVKLDHLKIEFNRKIVDKIVKEYM